MKIRELYITNFLTVTSGSVNFADRGLVLVQGQNDADSSADSNGSGKSTIADALCWTLYGSTARGEDTDKVVNRKAGKDCRVQVTVQDGSEIYRITRYRKDKVNKNGLTLEWLNHGAMDDLTQGTAALTQVEIDRIMGCSYDVFRAAIYAGQEQMPDLPGMTDKQLKVLVEEASGVTVLEQAYREANTRTAAQKGTVSTLEVALDREDRAQEERKELRAELADEINGFEEKRKIGIVEKESEIAILIDHQNRIVSERARFNRLSLEANIKKLDATIAGVAGEKLKEDKLAGDLRRTETAKARADAELANMVRQAKAARSHLAGIEGQIGCPCSECARPLGAADIKPARDAAVAKLTTLGNELRIAKAGAEATAAVAKSTADGLEAFRAGMTDVSAAARQRASLQADIVTLDKLDAAFKQDNDGLDRLRRELQSWKDALNPHEAHFRKTEKAIEAGAEQIRELGNRLADERRDLKRAEIVAKVFSPAGVRAFILDEVTPFLNEQTAKYLSTLSDGNIAATWSTLVKNGKGELKEKFSIEVQHELGGETFRSISGGEQRKVRIAAALALQDLVARRATKPIDLFIGDEIDNALDPAGIERLTTILEEKARERGSVFIISHSDLKDWISNTITVVKRGKWDSIIEESVS